MADPAEDRIFLSAADGVRIAVSRLRAGHREAVVIAPGFFQSKDTPTFRRIARDFARDFDVLAVDFRGHGASGGRYTFSEREPLDLEAVAAFGAGHYEGLWAAGFSYGGAIALLAQSGRVRFRGIACVGSPMAPREIEFEWWRRSSIRSGRRSLEPGCGCRMAAPWRARLGAIDAVRGLSDTRLLFVHGSEDRIVHPRHSRMMYDAAPGPKELHIIGGGGHAEDLFRTHPAELRGIFSGWFERAFARAATREPLR